MICEMARAKKTAAKKTVAKKKTTAKKKTSAKKKTAKERAADRWAHIYAMRFGKLYPMYVQKAEKKGRTEAEVHEIITWLTGYTGKKLQAAIEGETTFGDFFTKAPRFNAKASLITGTVCGIRVEQIEDPLVQKVRYLDKLIDELARGKKMSSILRS